MIRAMMLTCAVQQSDKKSILLKPVLLIAQEPELPKEALVQVFLMWK